MIRVVLGLGSNVGDRAGYLQDAAQRIRKVCRIERASRMYQTKPVGPVEQTDFYNAALLVTYDGEPLELLDVLNGIEAGMGRRRGPDEMRWGPRRIDIDILWVEGLAMESDRLVIPHPRLTHRAFALRPLVDVAPDAIDPLSQLPYTRLFDQEAARLRPLPFELFGDS